MAGTISIGDSQRNLEDADAQWVAEQINRRRRDGESICVRVTINKQNLNLALSSADCPPGAGGGRRPNREEQAVLDEWSRRGLNGSISNPGPLIAFLQQVY